ncbi:hypothetical protein BCR33DRAFT_849065 [Rhizoclosmatium globosum]|uniref:Zn(2)-C6 fungal-type domain-containing protein n=1 Tax=Rhizoclosmatium globosum TaxID=329046 RepID=A0A1Y2CJF4_9FUNG|nr:hypothetical protein BCR33DRAFT_849065 [Rhizoclosmatium globosum]|eukprot:ORY47076.1 hypothetical protein BCR33DRAFT_849065 [Rhizoclosmatium globosum]
MKTKSGRPQPCLRCKQHRKRCEPGLLGCVRCVRQGHVCEFESDVLLGSSVSGTRALDTIASAFESPLSAVDDSSKCVVEDRDLMPTIEDFAMVHRFYTNDGTKHPVFFSHDGDWFLASFFNLNPLLRLSVCALVACRSNISELAALSYYKRARKALIRAAADPPCLQTVQALFNIHLFAEWKGQPVIGRQFLKASLDMILQLQLHIDPDDSEWLLFSFLTPRQKEERRRAFWASYWFYKSEYAVSLEAINTPLTSEFIKPPSAIMINTTMIFETCNTSYLCDLCDLLGTIKREYSLPPRTLDSFILPRTGLSLATLLIKVHSRIPPESLLIASSPTHLTAADKSRFLHQTTHSSLCPYHTYMLTLYTLSTLSTLHRPLLLLTTLQAFHPLLLSRETTSLITSAVTQCIESAHRIATLTTFAPDHIPPKPSDELGKMQSVYPCFEALFVLWFTSCRMPSVWWDITGISTWKDKRGVSDGVLSMLENVRQIGKESTGDASVGSVYPLLRCMEAMVDEMQGNIGEVVESPPRHSEDELVLGMTVMSLGESDGDHFEEEPWSFLGLLGMEVGGIRWKGRTEESWRLFWKLHS